MFEPVPDGRSAVPRSLHFAAQGAGRRRGAQPARAAGGDFERRRRRRALPFHTPAIAVRTGDTPAAERAKFQRAPADILITTPESLFLLLTSNAHESLRSVETVIIDEIHALVSTKRGAHLALSLERLERIAHEPLQRIGLSATQRPLDEVARYLGGAQRHSNHEAHEGARSATNVKTHAQKTDFADSVHEEFEDDRTVKYRPVTIVDASAPKKLAITVQTPVEDMAAMGKPVEQPSGPASQGPVAQSIWSSDSSEAGRADSIASLDAAVRQQPAPRGTAGRSAQRDCRRAAGARASRIAGARAADRDRGPAEGRTPARAGGDLVSRARHRHGRDRPGDPDRGAAVGGQRPAAHRPRRPQHRSGQRRRHLSEVSRRPRGLRRRHRGDAAGQGGIVPLSAQSARRARAAARGDGRRWSDGRWTISTARFDRRRRSPS